MHLGACIRMSNLTNLVKNGFKRIRDKGTIWLYEKGDTFIIYDSGKDKILLTKSKTELKEEIQDGKWDKYSR